MLRNLCFMSSVCGVAPAEAIAVATGNTAKAHGLDVGVLAPGRPADIVVCGPVEGSTGTSIADAIAHGDLPGIAYVIADGEIVVSGRSRQTPPPQRNACSSPAATRTAERSLRRNPNRRGSHSRWRLD